MAIMQTKDAPFNMNHHSKTSRFLPLLLGTVFTLITFQLFRTWWRLRHIPGPFLASLTNLQRVWWVKTRHAQITHQQIHERYGAVVRFGPNMVSISDPAAIPTVYPMPPGFVKVRSCTLSRPAVIEPLRHRLLLFTGSFSPRILLVYT